MPANSEEMLRLLFAILKQKDLKDVDWDKVATDEVLVQEISNGHAARMRYSRFKSAMSGTPNSPSPRKQKSPRKPKVEKKAAGVKRGRRKQSAADNLKLQTPEMTPDVGIKAESEMPATPPSQHSYLGSPEASPSTGQSQQSFGHGPGADMDDMMTSFGMSGDNGMYPPSMMAGHGHGGYGSGMSPMGMNMGMGVDPFELENVWSQDQRMEEKVKKEPRWGDEYRDL